MESEHQKEIAEDNFNIEGVLATGWSSLDSDKREQFTQRFEQLKRTTDSEKEVNVLAGATVPTVLDGETRPAEDADQDTEMADDTGTPGGTAEVGGFTAVNRT